MSTTSSLVYKDLRGYLDAVEQLGELRVVKGADWDLELGAITEVAARATQPKGFVVRRHQRISKRVSRCDQSRLFCGDHGFGVRFGSKTHRSGSYSCMERKSSAAKSR